MMQECLLTSGSCAQKRRSESKGRKARYLKVPQRGFDEICLISDKISRIFASCPLGGIGRRSRLKICRPMVLPVRVWQRAPHLPLLIDSFTLCALSANLKVFIASLPLTGTKTARL